MKTVIYAGNIGSPNTAAAIHAERVGNLMEEIGYRVVYCCEHVIKDNPTEDTRYRYAEALAETGRQHTMDWIREQYTGKKIKDLLIRTIEETKPECMILYNPFSNSLYRYMLKYCRKHDVKLVVELTEWRDLPLELLRNPGSYLHFGIAALKNYRIRFLDRKCGNMIGISEYICNHYRKQGGHVIQLPPLFGEDEFAENVFNKTPGTPIRLVFAGSLEVKDNLMPLIRAMQKLNTERIRFTLDIIGPDKKAVQKEYMRVSGFEMMDSEAFIFHGRMPHDKVLDVVHESDFSILLRENARYAKAGVSTKFAEACCMGTPSICTTVGGTDLFVEDGVNGILVPDNREETIINALERISRLSTEQLNMMKQEVHSMGRKNFLDRQYRDVLSAFLTELR